MAWVQAASSSVAILAFESSMSHEMGDTRQPESVDTAWTRKTKAAAVSPSPAQLFDFMEFFGEPVRVNQRPIDFKSFDYAGLPLRRAGRAGLKNLNKTISGVSA